MFMPKQGMSNVWCGITENAKFLCEGMQVAVNNGKNTLFWDHKWVSKTTLSSLAIKLIPDALIGATVGEMWDNLQGWKWEDFAEFLPTDVLKQIQSYELN